jgi:hypothetical protein
MAFFGTLASTWKPLVTIVGMTILVFTNQTFLVIDQRHIMEGRAQYMVV